MKETNHYFDCVFRFVRLQERLRKSVGCLEFFTSKGWQFSNNNLLMLDDIMSAEDRKVSAITEYII